MENGKESTPDASEGSRTLTSDPIAEEVDPIDDYRRAAIGRYEDFCKDNGVRPVWHKLLEATAKVYAMIGSGTVLEVFSDGYLSRGAGGPLDIANHIGNFREASIVTSGSICMIGIFACARLFGAQESTRFKNRARLSATCAFVASSLVQLVGERYGINNVIGGSNTPDMLDAYYGIAWSGVTAALGYRWLNLAHLQTIKTNKIKENAWLSTQTDY